jgi:hypothetical protein
VDRSCILDPLTQPLPFTPFKDFTGRSINEINLYSTEMSSALCSIDRVSASANMNNRLSEAIVETYKSTNGAPISFELMLKCYQSRMKDANNDDSISSVLKQLVNAHIFESEDKVSLIDDSYIIKMDGYPKDGPIAKAIVYFLMSKLNNIYELLDKQAVNDEVVQIRHFAIIDLQRPFFQDGDESSLRPMILKDVAERAQLDISTISRVSNSKYVQTNFGIYPLKFFFSDGYVTENGEELSVREIKQFLKECIDKENKDKPYTDDELADMLKEKGYPIARRTVAKYRQQLNIPVARLRR